MATVSLALIAPTMDMSEWRDHLASHFPQLKIEVYPNIENPEDVEYALLWRHPRGIVAQFPKLRWVSSLGAGVEHIIYDPDLPASVIVTRIVGKKLAREMARYHCRQEPGGWIMLI